MNPTHLLSLVLVLSSSLSIADVATPPTCEDKRSNQMLNVMNDQVLEWKTTSRNQFLARARISGRFVGELRSRDTHKHWAVQIGPNQNDKIELVYNRVFGDLPEAQQLQAGESIEICGDYITSNAPTGRYEASPLGAIIHWTHMNPGDRDGGAHEHGYVFMRGAVFGFDYTREQNSNNGQRTPNRRKPRRPNLMDVLGEGHFNQFPALAQ